MSLAQGDHHKNRVCSELLRVREREKEEDWLKILRVDHLGDLKKKVMLVWFRKLNSSRLSSFGNGWCFTFENSHSVRLHEVSCAFFLIKCQVFPKSLAALICWANLVNFVLIWLIAASLDSAGVEIEGGGRGFDLILAISATFRIFSRTFRSVTQRRVSGRSFQISVISGVLELKLNFGWTFVAGVSVEEGRMSCDAKLTSIRTWSEWITPESWTQMDGMRWFRRKWW